MNAQEIIGVASAGFTDGAKKKAKRYGVHLRDLKQINDDEIANWGRQVALTIYYYQYSDVVVGVGFAAHNIPRIDIAVVSTELRRHAVLQSVFNAARSQLDTPKLLPANDGRTVPVRLTIRPYGVVLSGEPVLEMGLECVARLVSKPIDSPGVFGYGQPRDAPAQREATVERFAFGDTSIVHQDDRIAVDVDLSSVSLPPLSQIRFIRTTSAEELDYESFSRKDPRSLYVTNGSINVGVYGIHLMTEPPGTTADDA
jgi:hypothetical protein